MRNTNILILGFFLVFLGMAFLFDEYYHIDIFEFVVDLWPVLLIIIGWQIITKAHGRKAKEEPAAGRVSKDTAEDIPPGSASDKLRHSSFIGDISIRATSKNFQGGYVKSFIGDIHLNLSEIDVPGKERSVNISSVIGDVNVTLPKDFVYRIRGASIIGDIYILGQSTGGLFRHLVYRSDGYSKSDKQVHINISSVIGDIHIT